MFGDSPFSGSENGSLSGELSSVTSFGTLLDAEITHETIDFFGSDAQGDPDCPAQGFSSIEQALSTLRQGKFVIVLHDKNGDAEGILVMAAALATPESVAFMVKHGSGIVSVGMKGEDLERLNIPLMSPENEDDLSARSFTVSVVNFLHEECEQCVDPFSGIILLSQVTLIGNWFGESRRGLIMGVWNAHTYVGKLAAIVLDYGRGWSFILPDAFIFAAGLIVYLFLPAYPEDVGFPMRNGSDENNTSTDEEFMVQNTATGQGKRIASRKLVQEVGEVFILLKLV